MRIHGSSLLRHRWPGLVALALGTAVLPAAQEWRQYADPAEAGWSAAELEAARSHAVDIGTTAVWVVDHGHVVAAWGEVDYPYASASLRKSLYDAAMGAVHLREPFDLDTTLAELEIDDLSPLGELEKTATIEDLMCARSGVYHPAAYETASNARRRPERHSHAPGEFWYYNNWDFNVLCVAFERAAGIPMRQALLESLAGPLGMEDLRSEHLFEFLEPRSSLHPALTVRISARDLARVGLLYLQKGTWGEQVLVDPAWIERSTEALTTFEEGHERGAGNGYGRLWWIEPASRSAWGAHPTISARGNGGQLLVLIPALEVLVVHRSDPNSEHAVSDEQAWELVERIVAARKGEPAPDATLGAVHVEQLSGEAPTRLRTDLTAVPPERLRAALGTYQFTASTGMELYEHQDRLFARPIGMALADVELFEAGDGTLCSPVVDAAFEPLEEREGRYRRMRVTFRGETREGARVE